MTDQVPGYSIGAVARLHGVAAWQVRRTIERGFFPEPARIGPYRVFTPEQLPLIAQALVKAGYLPQPEAVAAKGVVA